jgi:hypothetical protein
MFNQCSKFRLWPQRENANPQLIQHISQRWTDTNTGKKLCQIHSDSIHRLELGHQDVCYQSTLFKFLQADMRKPRMKTVEELIENNFTLYHQPQHLDFLGGELEAKLVIMSFEVQISN